MKVVLIHAKKAYRESTGTAVRVFTPKHVDRWRYAEHHALAALPREKKPGTH
jgi:hypothetical protein